MYRVFSGVRSPSKIHCEHDFVLDFNEVDWLKESSLPKNILKKQESRGVRSNQPVRNLRTFVLPVRVLRTTLLRSVDDRSSAGCGLSQKHDFESFGRSPGTRIPKARCELGTLTSATNLYRGTRWQMLRPSLGPRASLETAWYSTSEETSTDWSLAFFTQAKRFSS